MHDFMNFSSNILQRLRREQEDIVSVTLPIVVTVYYRIGSQAMKWNLVVTCFSIVVTVWVVDSLLIIEIFCHSFVATETC